MDDTLADSAESHTLAHASIDRLLDDWLAHFTGSDPSVFRAAFEEIERSVRSHIAQEEERILPALLRRNPRMAWALIHEHRHLGERLQEVGTALRNDEISMQMARSLADEIRAHARSEEALLGHLRTGGL